MGKKQSIQEAKRRLSETLKSMPAKKISKQFDKTGLENLPKPTAYRGTSEKDAASDVRIKKGKKHESAEYSRPISRPKKKSKNEPNVPDNGNYPEASKDAQGQKAPFAKVASTVHEPTSDSTRIGEELFRMLIAPVTIKEFFLTYYEKKPLHVSRDNRSYYRDWMSMLDVRALVDSGTLEWSTEVRTPRSIRRNTARHAAPPIPSPLHARIQSGEVFGLVLFVLVCTVYNLLLLLFISTKRPVLHRHRHRHRRRRRRRERARRERARLE